MRKYLSIILFAITTCLFGQARLDRPEIYIGTSLGVSGSMVMFKPAVSQTYLSGYNGGLVFRYIAEKNVGMQAELNFSQRGWSESNGLYERQLNYIELPFMTHIFVGKKNRVFLNFGPKIAYLVSEKELKNSTLNSTDIQHTTFIQNPFDYGLCTGLGVLFNIRGNILQLDTRANFGLSDIFSNDKRDYFDTSNNLNVSVNLGWLIQLK
ncbi:MAG: PorT family protein [Paludibacter sp.]|nr:PorT family protein [Paludibacter sp.]